MIGQLVGNYKVVKLVGEGGMGTVYLAEHKDLGRRVAVKMLHPHLVRDPGIRARFKNEAALLGRLQHRNIVTLYDYLEDGDNLFLVMEYVEGRDLSELVRNEYGPFPPPLLKSVFDQVLDALGYAHSQNIIHRDIKPSNFILTKDGVIKVLDFGIAKIFGEGDHNFTKTGTRMGTVFYMSPEQVRGEKPDVRSDIYSLGVMLYNLATGQLPYNSDSSEFEIYNQIVSQPLPAASATYPGVSNAVEHLIKVATQKDPALRFQNCAEFRRGRRSGGDSARPSGQAVQQPDPREAKTVVDAGSNPVVPPVSQPQPKQIESPATKKIAHWDRNGFPFIVIFTTVFLISFLVAIIDSNPVISPWIALLTANYVPVFIGSLVMKAKKRWGVVLSGIFLILELVFVPIALIGVAISIEDARREPDEGEIYMMIMLFGFCTVIAIWGLRSVFSKGAAKYFQNSKPI